MIKNLEIAKRNFSKICDKFLGQTITCQFQGYIVTQIKRINIHLNENFHFYEWIEQPIGNALPQFKDCFEITFEAESEVKGNCVKFPVFVNTNVLFKNNRQFIFKYGLIFDCIYCEVEAEEVGLSVLNEV